MKAGFAVCDITPPLGLYLTGYGNPERLAEGIHSPLEATIMLLEEEGKKALVIGLDWCTLDWELTNLIRKGIMEKTAIPESHILLACTHTHSAPATSRRRGIVRSDVDPEFKGADYACSIIPKLAEKVGEAAAHLRECKAGFGHTHTQTGVNRRGTDENGRVAGFIEDPYQICDSNMTIAYFRDKETNEDLGIFVHASAHNTAMGGNRLISSDWCGFMRKRIRSKYDIPVVFINGAIGDVGPRTNQWKDFNPELKGFSAGGGDGIESVEEVGSRAASDALRVLEGIRDFRETLPLKIHVGELKIPQKLPMTKEEAKALLDEIDRSGKKDEATVLEYQVAKLSYAAWEKPLEEELLLEQTLIAFGPVALVPFPFEMFSIFSLRLRKYGPFAYTLLTSNTNGYWSYMPDRGSLALGGYEATWLKYVRTYVIKPEAGDAAVSQSLASLRKM